MKGIIDEHSRTIDDDARIISDHERTIARLSNDLRNADDQINSMNDKYLRLEADLKQLQRDYDEIVRAHNGLQDKGRSHDDHMAYVKTTLLDVVYVDLAPDVKKLHAQASAQELAQKAASLLGDLRERNMMLTKKDQQATTALSSAASKILNLERDLHT